MARRFLTIAPAVLPLVFSFSCATAPPVAPSTSADREGRPEDPLPQSPGVDDKAPGDDSGHASPEATDSPAAHADAAHADAEHADGHSGTTEDPLGAAAGSPVDPAEAGGDPAGGSPAAGATVAGAVVPGGSSPPPARKPAASSGGSTGGGGSPGPASVPPLVTPTIRMLSPATELSVGDRVSITIDITDGTDVGSVPFHVIYNPDVLVFEGGEEGSFLGGDGRPTAFFAAAMSNGREVAVGLSRLGRGMGIAGRGELCRLTFVVVGVGDAGLGFTRAHLRDSTNEILPAEFEASVLTAR